MTKRSRSSKPKTVSIDLSKDLWISPRLNLRGRDGDRAWDSSGNLLPGAGARFLELADIALGIKKPAARKKKAASASVHKTNKDEPYLE
jgi:hypothetical protein